MWWHPTLAHPGAFTFRPLWSTIDGAAVLHLLLEVCLFMHRVVAGMGTGYFKIFQLIPRRVVLPTLEVGHRPGHMPRTTANV